MGLLLNIWCKAGETPLCIVASVGRPHRPSGAILLLWGWDMMCNYQVYVHENLVNGKMYIGATKKTWADRWKKKYKNNKHMNAAIRKYGEECWTHAVLKDGLTREQAAEYEKTYIMLFDTRNPANGYNVGRGGEGIIEDGGLTAVQSTEEYRKHLSDAMKSVWERRRSSGNDEPFFSQDVLEKMRVASTERWKDAAYREKVISSNAEYWKKKQKDPNYIAERDAKRVEENRRRRVRRKRVPSELRREHASAAAKEVWKRDGYREAASARSKERWKDSEYRDRVSEKVRERMLGSTHSDDEALHISHAMKEKWKDEQYAATLQKAARPGRTDEQKKAARDLAISNGTCSTIRCIETGKIYPCASDAGGEFGMSGRSFMKALRKQTSIHGFHYEIVSRGETRPRGVVCTDTGVRYSSLKEASKATGVSAGNISNVCCGKRKIAGGFHWRYEEEGE